MLAFLFLAQSTHAKESKKGKKEKESKKSLMGKKEKSSKKGGSNKISESSGSQQPLIFDTDYGPFIDDVFAMGLLLNSADLIDLKYVITTSERPGLSAQCVTKHLALADRLEIPVGVGAEFPDYDLRGGVCGIPGLVGFALEEECADADFSMDEDGVAAMAEMLMASDRDDWWYLVVGAQSSVKALIETYPQAADKISTLIVMGGNWW